MYKTCVIACVIKNGDRNFVLRINAVSISHVAFSSYALSIISRRGGSLIENVLRLLTRLVTVTVNALVYIFNLIYSSSLFRNSSDISLVAGMPTSFSEN